MPGRYDASRVNGQSKLVSECDGLVEKDNEWWIDMISIPKSSRRATNKEGPTYRRGWTYGLEDEMRFVSIPFAREDGTAALAVVLRGKTDDYFAGWFNESRGGEVRRIVDHLNSELEAERLRCAHVIHEEVLFEIGSENAPDSPFGSERIRFTPDGAIHYEQINRGSGRAAVGGVDPALWTSLMVALAKTSFPARPERDLPPGGSIVVLTVTGRRSGRVLLEYYDALEMEGYGEIVAPLANLCDAIRTNDQKKLAELGYRGAAVQDL
jgi:hypothetical protein